MGTRIGYRVLSHNDTDKLSPALMLLSDEPHDDMQAIFQSACKLATGPTDLLTHLTNFNHGREQPFFAVEANHKGTDRIITVWWEPMSGSDAPQAHLLIETHHVCEACGGDGGYNKYGVAFVCQDCGGDATITRREQALAADLSGDTSTPSSNVLSFRVR